MKKKKEGRFQYHDHEYKLVDLPGTYSLSLYHGRAGFRQYILSDDVDVIIDVADLPRWNEIFTSPFSSSNWGKPVILALNMMDIVEERAWRIDTHRLPEMLGIPVIQFGAP